MLITSSSSSGIKGYWLDVGVDEYVLSGGSASERHHKAQARHLPDAILLWAIQLMPHHSFPAPHLPGVLTVAS